MEIKKIIGIDIGGTSAKIGLVSENGQVIEKANVPTLKISDWKKIIGEYLKPVLNWIESGNKIIGIGIGIPGFYNIRTKLIYNCQNIPGLIEAPIIEYMNDKLKIPIFVDNDATSAALGEQIFGIGIKFRNYLMITLGTGIGGGLVLNNEIYRGHNGYAGEFGHIAVEPDGRICTCGKKGCIEAYASATAIIKMIKEGIDQGLTKNYLKDEKLTGKLIFEKAKAGDDFSVKIIDKAIKYLGIALGSAVNLLNIEAVIIGGGLAKEGEEFINRIRKECIASSWKMFTNDLQIVQSSLLDNAGVLGAVSLVVEGLKNRKSV
jgi:glucokinase